MNSNNSLVVVNVSEWGAAATFFKELRTVWLFRGQRDAKWPLQTSLERKADQWDCAPGIRWLAEQNILKSFSRHVDLYGQGDGKQRSSLDALALLQHHGGPTRLLDWTYSFYVAAFFAVEDAKKDVDAAVWAIDWFKLAAAVNQKLSLGEFRPPRIVVANAKVAEYVLRADVYPKPLVLHTEPHVLHERLAVQQGTFLFPTDCSLPFIDNLTATFDIESGELTDESTCMEPDEYRCKNPMPNVLKIVLRREAHKDALQDLRAMNIHAAALYPGLGGYAQSLAYELMKIGRGLKEPMTKLNRPKAVYQQEYDEWLQKKVLEWLTPKPPPSP